MNARLAAGPDRRIAASRLSARRLREGTPSDTLIDHLKQAIAARQTIVVMGAGVSVAATANQKCASWTGLLHDGVDRCAALGYVRTLLAQGLHAQIDPGGLDFGLGAADVIAAKLCAPKGGEYSRWLRESVGTLKVAHRYVLEALAALRAPLVTTNYDEVTEVELE